MSESRFKNDNKIIEDFYDKINVKCPSCQKNAFVFGGLKAEVTRVSCTHCGYTKTKTPPFGYKIEDRAYDPYFSLPLILQIDIEGETLWALNSDHLSYLEDFVKATQRLKSDEVANRSIISRLPRWIKSAKNRESILEAIKKLRKKLAD